MCFKDFVFLNVLLLSYTGLLMFIFFGAPSKNGLPLHFEFIELSNKKWRSKRTFKELVSVFISFILYVAGIAQGE